MLDHTRAALLAVFIGGCSPAPPVRTPPVVTASVASQQAVEPARPKDEPTFDAIGEAATFLAEGFADRELRRARLRRVGPLFWDLAAAEERQPGFPGNEDDISERTYQVVVAERHREHVRVVHEASGVRLTGYMSLDDFHEVPRRAVTLLSDDGEPFANGCGVTVPAGTMLALRKVGLGFRRATLVTDEITAHGGLSEDSIDRVFVASPDKDEHAYDCQLKKGEVTLRDAPNGNVVATLANASGLFCQRDGPPRDGARRIKLVEDGHVVVGFAPVDIVGEIDPGTYGAFGTGVGGGWASSHASYAYLWPGDVLLAGDPARPVGRVLRRAFKVNNTGKDSAGLLGVSFPVSPWSFQSMRIDDETLQRAKAKHTAWLGRVAFGAITVTGGGDMKTVEQLLRDDRHGVSVCYDNLLEKEPGVAVTYDVEIEYSEKRPRPALTPSGVHRRLESCLQIWLRSNERTLRGSRAKLTLALKPSPLVD